MRLLMTTAMLTFFSMTNAIAGEGCDALDTYIYNNTSQILDVQATENYIPNVDEKTIEIIDAGDKDSPAAGARVNKWSVSGHDLGKETIYPGELVLMETAKSDMLSSTRGSNDQMIIRDQISYPGNITSEPPVEVANATNNLQAAAWFLTGGGYDKSLQSFHFTNSNVTIFSQHASVPIASFRAVKEHTYAPTSDIPSSLPFVTGLEKQPYAQFPASDPQFQIEFKLGQGSCSQWEHGYWIMVIHEPNTIANSPIPSLKQARRYSPH